MSFVRWNIDEALVAGHREWCISDSSMNDCVLSDQFAFTGMNYFVRYDGYCKLRCT